MTAAMSPCAAITRSGGHCRRGERWQIDGSALPLRCWQHAVAAARDLNLPRIVDLLSGRIRNIDDLPQPRSTR